MLIHFSEFIVSVNAIPSHSLHHFNLCSAVFVVVCLLGIANAYASMGQNDGKLCHDSAATTIKHNKEEVNRSETHSQKLSLEQRSKRKRNKSKEEAKNLRNTIAIAQTQLYCT